MPIYQTYLGSLRPKGGVTDEDIQKVLKWLKKKMFYTCGLEKKDTDGAHLHFVWAEHKTMEISNARKLLRAQLQHIVQQDRCVGLGQEEHCLDVTIWYNKAGYDYATKDNDILLTNIDEQEDFELIIPALWPEKDDQQNKKNTTSIWYHNLEKKYLEQHEHPPPTLKEMKEFVMGRMVNERDVEMISDKRIFTQKCEALLRFIRHDNRYDPEPEMGICERCRNKRDLCEFVS